MMEKRIESDFALAQQIYDKIVGKNEELMPYGDRKMLFALCLIYSLVEASPTRRERRV